MGGRNDCFKIWGSSFEAKYWLSLDPCGLVCVSFSFFVHAYATTVSGLYLMKQSVASKVVYIGIYLPLTVMAVWSLYKAWRTDPGAVPMGARPLKPKNVCRKVEEGRQPPVQRAIRRCHKCNDNFKPARAHHDSVTGRCIVKFDHFCPWVGNAVGAYNHKFFCLFVGYTLSACIATIAMLVLNYIDCTRMDDATNEKGRDLKLSSTTAECLLGNPWVIILGIVAVLFALFTSVMLCDQIDAIRTNTSKIARMKLKGGQGGSELERVSQDFNEMFGSNRVAWHWFVPIDIKFPNDAMKKAILGYEWDFSFDDTKPFEEDDMVAAIQGGEDNGGDELFVDNDDDAENQIELERIDKSPQRAKKRVSKKVYQEVSSTE